VNLYELNYYQLLLITYFIMISCVVFNMFSKHVYYAYIYQNSYANLNLFEAEVQKLEADQLQLGTCSHLYYLMSCLVITIRWPLYVYVSHCSYMDHYIKKTIREFINLFETEIFVSRFTNIFKLIYFLLQIVNKNSNSCLNSSNNMCIEK
jgi:hypothetical protein